MPQDKDIASGADVSELPRHRFTPRLRIVLATCGLAIAAVLIWYYYVPVAPDLPIDTKWELIKKDWYGVIFTHTRYYRYHAEGVPEDVWSWVRQQLDRVGPWEHREDKSEETIVSELRGGRLPDVLEKAIRAAALRYSATIYDRQRGLDNPGHFFFSQRSRHKKSGTAYRIISVRVSAETGTTCIVEIWDIDRFDN